MVVGGPDANMLCRRSSDLGASARPLAAHHPQCRPLSIGGGIIVPE